MSKLKITAIIAGSLIFATSISINVIYFKTRFEIRNQTEIVDENIQSIIDKIETDSEILTEKTEENIKDLHDSFNENDFFEVVDEKTVATITKDNMISITIDGVNYLSILPEELEKSKELNVFLSNQINEISSAYLEDIEQRDKKIEELTEYIESAQDTIHEQLEDAALGTTQENLKKNLIRFGIGGYYSGTLYSSPSINLGHSVGISGNMMILNKLSIGMSFGIQVINSPLPSYNPQAGLSAVFYF